VYIGADGIFRFFGVVLGKLREVFEKEKKPIILSLLLHIVKVQGVG
jgi:hypothetical protein